MFKKLPFILIITVLAILSCTKDPKNDTVVAPPQQFNLEAPAWVRVVDRSQSWVIFSWGAVDSADYYIISRSADSSGTFDSIGRTTDTSYRDTGLYADTTYYYRIRAGNGIGVSAQATAFLAKTLPGASAPPTNVTASVSGNVITVSWTPPAGAIDHYRLYRSTHSLSNGSPDTASFVSVHEFVPGDSSSYRETTGLASGIYWYALRAAQVADTDTIVSTQGPAWPALASCTVGSLVGFSINNGDLFTAARSCTLYLDNKASTIQSIKFTSMVQTDTMDANGVLHPVSPVPISGDTFGQLTDMKAYLDLISAGSSAPSKPIRYIPRFDIPDAENDTSMHSSPADGGIYAWVLPSGPGTKFVFAQVQLSVNGQTILDTLVDDILIKPYEIALSCATSNTCRFRYFPSTSSSYFDTTTLPYYTYYAPSVSFSVQQDNDTNIESSFDYWIVTSTNSIKIDISSLNNTYARLAMSKPVLAQYSGNSQSVYALDFDSTTISGKENLNYATVFQPYYVRTIISSLPKYAYDTLWYYPPGYVIFQESIDSNPPASGMKDFLLVVRFTEKQFGTKTINILGYNQLKKRFATSFDGYPPLANPIYSPLDSMYLDSTAAITGTFNFGLRSRSIIDVGRENITSVSLIIARQPDSSFTNSSGSYLGLTPDILRSFRHNTYPFPVNDTSYVVQNVGWTGIDPTGWPAGRYIFAIVTKDEFNHESIAFGYNSSNYRCIPFRMSYGGN